MDTPTRGTTTPKAQNQPTRTVPAALPGSAVLNLLLRLPGARAADLEGTGRPQPPGATMPTPRASFADAHKIAYQLLFVAHSEDRGRVPISHPAWSGDMFVVVAHR